MDPARRRPRPQRGLSLAASSQPTEQGGIHRPDAAIGHAVAASPLPEASGSELALLQEVLRELGPKLPEPRRVFAPT
jgi:hypothetical protein